MWLNENNFQSAVKQNAFLKLTWILQQRVTGVRCFEAMNVTMSRAIATQLLEVSNA